MQVGYVERLGVQHANVAGPQAVRQALELRQHSRPGRVQTRRDEHVAEVHLEEIKKLNCVMLKIVPYLFMEKVDIENDFLRYKATW